MTLYLSRLTVARDPAVSALSALLDPVADGARMDAHHRLLWSAFAGDPEAARDFLWRAEGKGRFLVLSARAPAPGPLFDPPEVRPFAPDLAAGDRLAFVLRANATRARKGVGRVDVVMDALHGVAKGERAAQRMALAQTAAEAWMAAQGERAGFALSPDPDRPGHPMLAVEDYSTVALPKAGPPHRRPQFGVLEMTGKLTVTDPAAFLAKLAAGFGRAKAFGCGLMLIRRA